MNRQIIIIFATMLLFTSLAQVQEISLLNPAPSSGPVELSGPRNYALSSFSYTPVDIDLNEDGIPDVRFSGRHLITADVPTSGGGGSISINTLGNYVLSANHYALPKPTVRYIGGTVAQSGKWDRGSFTISSYSENYIMGTSTGWLGPWADVDVGYLSVLFRDSSNQLHSAAIRLLVPDDGPLTMYIMDWFYEINPLPEPTATGTTLLPPGTNLEFSFSGGHTGLEYVLEHSTNLVDGAWETNRLLAAHSDSIFVTNAITAQNGYFRLKRKQ